MISSTEFWNWFKGNNAKFFFLNQIEDEVERERILDEFLKKLHEFSPGLYFEIGGHPDEVQDLIISAAGDVQYFDKVEELVRSAPKLPNWNVVAFKPPANSTVISQDGVTIDANRTWFMPLQNKKNPKIFGVRLFINGFSDTHRATFLNAAYLVLDSLLGEKSSALNIHHVEVASLPIDPIEIGLFPLSELPQYISKRNLNTDHFSN